MVAMRLTEEQLYAERLNLPAWKTVADRGYRVEKCDGPLVLSDLVDVAN